MSETALMLLLLLTSAGAGMLGALTGLGGGVVLVPLLVILFKIDLHHAMGASLISVIATSSGAAIAYLKEGFSNIRIGIFLEMATTVGAITGAWATHIVPVRGIAVIFGLVLLYSAYLGWKREEDPTPAKPTRLSERLQLVGDFPVAGGRESYAATRIPAGFATMFGAGTLSGLLGIGSGAVKVLAMDHIMRLPFKVSTTTSNFMIGVTAAASAGIYFRQGYLRPALDFPVMLGVLLGALLGARLLAAAHVRVLRALFTVVIVGLALEMLYQGFAGRL
jgi:uncharacterized membrane protein YfcA